MLLLTAWATSGFNVNVGLYVLPRSVSGNNRDSLELRVLPSFPSISAVSLANVELHRMFLRLLIRLSPNHISTGRFFCICWEYWYRSFPSRLKSQNRGELRKKYCQNKTVFKSLCFYFALSPYVAPSSLIWLQRHPVVQVSLGQISPSLAWAQRKTALPAGKAHRLFKNITLFTETWVRIGYSSYLICIATHIYKDIWETWLIQTPWELLLRPCSC